MFYRAVNALATLARPEAMPSPRATGGGAAMAEDAARRSMRRELNDMPVSQRLADPAAYRRLQQARRQSLEALLPIKPDDDALRRAMDVIGMIVEESCWSENPNGAPFDDDSHPEIDFQCAETAALLGWAARAFGDQLSSRVMGKLLYETRRRVFSPFLAHADYPFMRAHGPRPLSILADIAVAAILLETSEQRRGAILKQAMRLIDQAIGARERRVEPLPDAAGETAAVTDLAALIRRLTRNQVDLTPVYPTQDWLDALLFPWLEGEYFADPASGSMLPPVSGEELFRVGLAANDEALIALGARLHRARRVPSSGVTGRILDLSCRSMLDAETGRPPRIKSAAAPKNRVMVSRFSGMTCALHTGGGHANAGGLILLSDGKPVLAESEGLCSVPLIGGKGQLASPDLTCEAEYDVRAERDTMSVDLTPAYPAGIANACQRTAMVQRADAALRVVDALDLAEPATVAFRFVTPRKPEFMMGGLRLGDVDFTWEGDLRPNLLPSGRRFPDGDGPELTVIELTTAAPVTRAFFTFNFTRQ